MLALLLLVWLFDLDTPVHERRRCRRRQHRRAGVAAMVLPGLPDSDDGGIIGGLLRGRRR
jgi:hypothetical protein